MNVIVTDNKIVYNGFLKVDTVASVLEMTGSIDILVYHKSNESTEVKVDSLSKLKERVKTFIYIRDKSKLEQAVQIVVLGTGGKYFDDEFFLESSNDLNELIRSLDQVTAIVEMGGVNVLSDFFERYLRQGSSNFNSAYLSVVKRAVQTMIADYQQKDLEILQMSETATELFASSANILSKVETERENLKSMLSNLQSSRDVSNISSVSATASVSFFPTVSYLKEKNIIRIKSIGDCMFLHSMMFGMRVYLEKVKNVRPKLIFVEPVGMQYEKLYKDYKWVTQHTCKSMVNYYNNVVFTNYPNKEVLTKLIEDTDYDTFIIVDFLKSSRNHILNSRGSFVKYAISGDSLIEKFNLKRTECFSIIKEVKGTLFTLPMFNEYPNEKELRERQYMRVCEPFYEMLYDVKRR